MFDEKAMPKKNAIFPPKSSHFQMVRARSMGNDPEDDPEDMDSCPPPDESLDHGVLLMMTKRMCVSFVVAPHVRMGRTQERTGRT